MPKIQELMRDQQSPLAYIFKQVRELERLTAALTPLLPPEFSGQCRVLNFRSGTLSLGVKQQALISRLYYLKADLIRSMQQTEAFRYVRAVKVLGIVDP